MAISSRRASSAAGTASTELGSGEPRYSLIPAAQIGIARPRGPAADYFGTTADVGLGLGVARVGWPLRLSFAGTFRSTLDPAPATRIWFAGAWLVPELTLWNRLVLGAGIGWSWRHIDIAGISSTRGSLSAVFLVGVRHRVTRAIEATLMIRDDDSRQVRGESFSVEHLGLLLSLAFVSGP